MRNIFALMFFLAISVSLGAQTYPSSTQVGLASARPTFCATPGQFYYATDTSVLYVSTVAGSSCVWANSTGSSSVTVNGSPLITPGTANLQNGSSAAAQIAFVNPGAGNIQGVIANLINPSNPGAGVMTGTQTNPLTNDVWSYNGTGLWTNQTLGVPPLPITSSSYAITSANRGNRLYLGASVTALTIPQAGSAGFGADFYLDIWNLQAGSVSLTPATSTVTGGSLNVIGAAAATIEPGDYCHLSGNNINYFMSCTSQSDIVVPTGVDPTGSVDSYAAMQASLNQALAAYRELYIPCGIYLTSASITSGGSIPVKISGCGVYNNMMGGTIVEASGPGYPTMSLGVGNGNFVDASSGYIKNITLLGDLGYSANTGIASLQINGMSKFSVEEVLLEDNDVGLDFVNNCFGSQVKDVRILNVNIGVYLRTGSQSGSDLSFYNMWIASQYGAVWISPGGGGYHFINGQMWANGAGSPNDNDGTIVLGKDWITGSTSGGDISADFRGTSFEGTQFVWVFRSFEQAKLSAFDINVNPSSGSSPAIGFFKGTDMSESVIGMHNVGLTGYFSNATLLSFAGVTTGWPQPWIEDGTYSAAQNPTIDGTPALVDSMLFQSFGVGGVSKGYSNGSATGSLGLQFIAQNQLAVAPAFGSQTYFAGAACETSYGATTVSGGATTTTGLNCLPANAIIDAVVYRITTTITTATSFTIGDSGSATRYCGTQSTLTAGTTGICTAAGYYLNGSAAGVLITPSTTPGAGAIRLIVYYHTWAVPTS